MADKQYVIKRVGEHTSCPICGGKRLIAEALVSRNDVRELSLCGYCQVLWDKFGRPFDLSGEDRDGIYGYSPSPFPLWKEIAREITAQYKRALRTTVEIQFAP